MIMQEIVCEVFAEVEPSEVLAWFQRRIDSDLALDTKFSGPGKVGLKCYEDGSSEFDSIDDEDPSQRTLDGWLIKESFPWPAIVWDQTVTYVDGCEMRRGVVVYYESPNEYEELSSVEFSAKLDVEYVAKALEDKDERVELERVIALQNRFLERERAVKEREKIQGQQTLKV